MTQILTKFRVSRNEKCLCGSNTKYKNCCLQYLKKYSLSSAHEFMDRAKYKQALIAFRALLSQYIIWHNEHTKPFVTKDSVGSESLLVTDIEAVSFNIHSIAICYNSLGKTQEIDQFLLYFSDAIEDRRFLFYLSALRSIWFSVLGDFEKASSTLKPFRSFDLSSIQTSGLGKISLIHFMETLWIELPLSITMSIVDRLLEAKITSSERISLNNLKTLSYYIYQDISSAKMTSDLLVNDIDKVKSKDKIERANNLFSKAAYFDIRSTLLYSNQSLKNKSIDLYTRLIPYVDDDSSSLAWVYDRIAYVYFSRNDLGKSKYYVELAYNLIRTDHIVIHLAKIYSLLKDAKNSEELLGSVTYELLNEYLRYDFLIVKAQNVINSKNNLGTKQIATELSKLKIEIPFLRELRDEFRIALIEFCYSKKESAGLLNKLRDIISRYFILQPNFFGLGININEIIRRSEKDV